MQFEQLWEIVLSGIKPKLEQSKGLSVFAKERAKFEGWLKVELCESLSDFTEDVTPERNRIDVTFDDWAIELKTINTNYRVSDVKNKHRPITKNTQGVVDDIERLKDSTYLNQAVLFVVFPAKHDKPWQTQLMRIEERLSSLKHVSFAFQSGVSGEIYLGLV